MKDKTAPPPPPPFGPDELKRFARETLEAANSGVEKIERMSRAELETAANSEFMLTILGMSVMSVEHKANYHMTMLTQGVIECMRQATILLPNAEMKHGQTPDARRSIRHAELQDMARLSDVYARMMDSYTRYCRGNSKQHSHVLKMKMEDGSTAQTTTREYLFSPGLIGDFGIGAEALAAVREPFVDAANKEPAKA